MIRLLILLTLALTIVTLASAGERPRVGIQITTHSIRGIESPTDLGVGGRALFSIGPFRVIPSLNYYWVGQDLSLSEKLFDFNVDGAYMFNQAGVVHPYLGGGLNIAHYSAVGRTYGGITTTASYAHTAPAWNVLGGIQLPVHRYFGAFAEIRYTHHSKIVASDEWVPVNRLMFSFGSIF